MRSNLLLNSVIVHSEKKEIFILFLLIMSKIVSLQFVGDKSI